MLSGFNTLLKKLRIKVLEKPSSCLICYVVVHCCSVTKLCPTLCDPMDYSTPGFPVHHQLPEFTQTHVHSVSDAIQPSHPLSSPSPPTINLSKHQGLFKWVSSLHQVTEVLEFQLQHQSFQYIFIHTYFSLLHIYSNFSQCLSSPSPFKKLWK